MIFYLIKDYYLIANHYVIVTGVSMENASQKIIIHAESTGMSTVYQCENCFCNVHYDIYNKLNL